MPSDVVYDATLGSLGLKQVLSGSFNTNASPIAGSTSGGLDVDTYYGGPADPRASFSSGDIGTIVGVSNFCTQGLAVSSGTITIPYHKRADKSTFASGTSHFTVSGSNGLIVPTSFSVAQDDDGASANLECYFQSTDGFTVPFATNSSQSLSSQSFVGMYGLGPCSIDGTTLGETVGFTVNPGITVSPEKHNGGLFPDTLYITTRRPSIEIQFNDFDDVDSILGDAVWTAIGSNCVCYMRARSGAGYVANGTTSHVSFTFAGGIVDMQTVSASGSSSGVASVILYGESLTAAAGVAIS
jgi:hypothetical protein